MFVGPGLEPYALGYADELMSWQEEDLIKRSKDGEHAFPDSPENADPDSEDSGVKQKVPVKNSPYSALLRRS